MHLVHRKPYYQIIDGVPRCPFARPEDLRRALAFVAKKGDLLQISYPKSGTHWVQYITQLILREGDPLRTYEEFSEAAPFVEYRADAESYTASTPVRTLCTHLALRREQLNPDAKYVYVARNPWDVCVSLYHHVKDLSSYRFEDGSFDDFFEAFLTGDIAYGDYFEHVMAGYSLIKEPNVLFLTYEELITDTRGAVLRLARFIGDRYGAMLEEDGDVHQRRMDVILQASSAESMRNVMVLNLNAHPDPHVDKLLKDVDASSKRVHGGNTKLYNFVRNAKMGGWKDHFTAELLRRMEATIKEKTQGCDVMELWADVRRDTQRACEAE
ncbi:hypothetical protein HPB49_007325 [Dermacentor silvarum]|uniref:Uncharacterized protein n=1 Tax=Dermacentor silvarum TaxID=543639 RepID=A0ACB8D3T0_DERSI|nr:3-alpha-hydroxysteroid sulfotransferase [Dermacentor silvarum]KAH7959016.1 hypothetical protein HPB49_007325 [Dermacentor silvarum]